MLESERLVNSPLSMEQIKKIDGSGLSNIDRHYVRLLAHCLGCFKEISKNRESGALPKEEELFAWLSSQPTLMNDKPFISDLLVQLKTARLQLEILAEERKITPLELTFDELINAFISIHDD